MDITVEGGFTTAPETSWIHLFKSVGRRVKEFSGWSIKQWTSDEILNCIRECGEFRVYKAYYDYVHEDSKLTLVRLLILYLFGGLYVDTDRYEIDLTIFDARRTKQYHNMLDILMTQCGGIIYVPYAKNPLVLQLISTMLKTDENVFGNIYQPFISQHQEITCIQQQEKEPPIDIWNQNIFSQFYFYPSLNITQFPFRNANIKALVDIVNNRKVELLAFDTSGQTKLAVPSINSMTPYYNSEFEGILVKKTSFKRRNPIPKRIHQIWIGEKNPPLTYTETVRNINSEWQYDLWNEERLRKEIPEAFEDPVYKRVTIYCSKVDILRIYLLNKFGGIYLDCDFKWLKPLDDEFLHHNFFLAFISELHNGTSVNNNVIGSHPHSPVLDLLLQEIHRQHSDAFDAVEDIYTTSPGFYTGFVHRHPELDIFIYPSYYFFKTSEDTPRENMWLTTQTYAEHVGRYDGDYACVVNNELLCKDSLGLFLTRNGLVNSGLIIGDITGEFSRKLLSTWPGKLILKNQTDTYHQLVIQYNIQDSSCVYNPESVNTDLDFLYIENTTLEILKTWYDHVRVGGLILLGGDDQNRILVEFFRYRFSNIIQIKSTYRDINVAVYFIKP